jgi:hypothetical protein
MGLARELLLLQPGTGTNLGTAAEGLIAPHYCQRRNVAQEYLARKIEALAAVSQSSLQNTTLKYGTLAATSTPQLIATTTAGVVKQGITPTAVMTADGGLFPFGTAAVVHKSALRAPTRAHPPHYTRSPSHHQATVGPADAS